jgi:hypothetical protein
MCQLQDFRGGANAVHNFRFKIFDMWRYRQYVSSEQYLHVRLHTITTQRTTLLKSDCHEGLKSHISLEPVVAALYDLFACMHCAVSFNLFV